MTSTEYDPELYHLLHRGNPGDLRWYRERCAGAQRILELGCGDGRLLVPLAQDGAQVVGVDASEAMLARCAERFHRAGLRAELVCGDMSAFALPWRFDRVLIPYNSLYCLTTHSAQLACLKAVAHHLEPGGQLLLDAYAADPVAAGEATAEPVAEHVVALFHDGDRQVEVRERSEEQPDQQLINATYDYHVMRGDGTYSLQSWSILQRYVFPHQMRQLVDQAGLVLEAVYGDFDQAPFTDVSAQMVLVASKL